MLKSNEINCPLHNNKNNIKNELWRYDKNNLIPMCKYYIRRKQRYCSHRIADGNIEGYCSNHSKEGLNESRLNERNSRIKYECKEALNFIINEICCDEIDLNSKKRKRERNKRVSAPKRMANPFSVDLSPDLGEIDISSWFSDISKPVHIDIGCAKGRCIERLSLREERVGWNHLGIEIRPNTIKEAMDRVNTRNNEPNREKNLHFLACNFVTSIDKLFSAFPSNTLQLLSIQFPDPWRRKKHLKRMLIQDELVNKLSTYLPQHAIIYLSSDSNRVILWMIKKFLQNKSFKLVKHSDVVNNVDNYFHNHILTNLLISNNNNNNNDNIEEMKLNQNQNQEGESIQNNENVEEINENELEDGNDDNQNDNQNDNNQEEENELLEEIELIKLYEEYWISYNPLGELSERELVCEVDWRQVKRCLIMRC